MLFATLILFTLTMVCVDVLTAYIARHRS